MSANRIWDFRSGDADDNRTSPEDGGLRSLILSTALEFNYLKALVGFLALIGGPALLVGITPSLVLTLGRMKIHTTAAVTYAPVVAVITLALLLGIALWIGRPLVFKAIEKFWQLHYTVVFPLFVTFREIVRSVAEWLPGPACTRRQLENRRRFGTVLGALLIAGMGLALAATFDLSMGLHVIDVERVKPWAALRATLGNAAVVLGLSAAVESLYWVWRELKYRDRVLDWAPRTSTQAATIRVAHLSDPHFVGERYGFRMEAGTHGPRGNGCIQSALEMLADVHAANPLDRILITGDITDAGTRGEWAEFEDALERYPELKSRLSFVPGNHDVNIVDRNHPGHFELPWSSGQPLRQFRVMLALDLIQGDRTRLVDRRTGSTGPLLRDYLREGDRIERLRALAARGSVRGRREMGKVWEAIFPLVEPPVGGGYGVILLNSNARTHFSLTNALGVVSPSQLKALNSILNNSPHSSWLILLHHQVVEYPAPFISLTDRIGLALVNAPDVLDAITPHASRCMILHGHRHRHWIGISGNVVLCSAPSVTLGSQDESKFRGSFYIHQLAIADGAIRLIGADRVLVP